ncbi:MAG TPA: hypothetical protein VFL57_02995 [Bryobacteraceae bacterium]|nr:hypothetical protein [Bryobacteraceae bacterium]
MRARWALIATYPVFFTFCASAEKFSLDCGTPPPPLRSVLKALEQADDLEIDQSCAAEGRSKRRDKQLESAAKNNFCATNAPVTITTRTLRSLQRVMDNNPSIRKELKESREPLKAVLTVGGKRIGEGTNVQLVAYLLEAHFPKSNVRKGELVNCKLRGEANNDIHIALASSPNVDDVCDSFTAEMSPHFRPEAWNEVVKLSLGNRPVRVSGALFFDGSHRPCTPTKRASPPRASVWEIHPVYAFDICRFRTRSKCGAGNDSVWIPLHEWLGDEPDEDEH